MPDSRDPKVTRRDTLKLATAVGALGAGLGVTLGAKSALAGPLAIKEVQMKAVVSEKIMLPANEFGTVSLKISYLKADGSTQLLHAFDLTSHFLKLEGGSLNFSLQNHKDQKDTTLLDRSIYIKEQKI